MAYGDLVKVNLDDCVAIDILEREDYIMNITSTGIQVGKGGAEAVALKKPSIHNSVKILTETISEISAEVEVVNSTLLSLSNSIDEVNSFLKFSGLSENQQRKVIFSCVFDGKNNFLGEVITQLDYSAKSSIKAYADCALWANLRIDHYLTITGNVNDCSYLIPEGLALSECIGALNIIEN